MTDKQPRHCASCKCYTRVTNVAHQDRCTKFTNPQGETLPCVVARGSEDLCGGDGKAWEKGPE